MEVTGGVCVRDCSVMSGFSLGHRDHYMDSRDHLHERVRSGGVRSVHGVCVRECSVMFGFH